ncbi:MAG: hypothetical protein M1825_000416 [Sarcosagium campestre]|nr:MAG: hypothetical protein M1825_000416 [Sarcosagium campestre]
MSTASTQSRSLHRRRGSRQDELQSSRHPSGRQRRTVNEADAYNYALRVAYLSYLLQPRAKRLQHVPAPQAQPQRSATSINDLMKDFTIVRDSKSTRFPHGFVGELQQKITGVLVGKEQRKEYNDPAVKRTFAVFYTAFTEQSFKKRMEKDRRVEDLVLIFFSSATKELQKGKSPTDDSWKLMVDRHVALFVRLISSTLRDHDWVRDRPELTSRLTTLETKLLKHDNDLAASSQRAGGAGGSSVEVEVPRSYEVKDMPLVLVVARLFGVRNTQIQSDIDKYKSEWTEKAALTDLKNYQNLLNLNSRSTLRKDDFDDEEAYEAWKRAEGPDLSQMILAIMQSNPDLAKSAPAGSLPKFNAASGAPSNAADLSASRSRTMSGFSEGSSSYVIEQPLDADGAGTKNGALPDIPEGESPFTFIPPDPRAYFRRILAQALTHDMNDQELQSSEPTADTPAMKLLSKPSTELLNEICVRWRLPSFSRAVLFLDVIKEKFVDQDVSLDTLDMAFTFLKEPLQDVKKTSRAPFLTQLANPSMWTLADLSLNGQILSGLHNALLRDLYELLQHCYEPKPPSIGPIMFILENHIYQDPLFSDSAEEREQFAKQLTEGLRQRALQIYSEYLHKEIPTTQDEWEFYHIMQLGKAVLKLAERIQKRYRKNPEILGVNPVMVLVEVVLPAYAEDARDIIERIIDVARRRQVEISVQEGFDLYRELVEIRRVHGDALAGKPFPFKIEDLLADFVWRWIRMTDEKVIGWVDEAIKQDNFKVRLDHPDQIPTDSQRHSVSIIDVFRSFNQSIDQIAQLNWDDDLAYAKFMTALAKTIGIGLTRYCETIELRFSREMDRMTPEQEAALNQSRQERWVQLARDTWNSKEKIEPFQFFPQSFVKLNNIEFATSQLDALERSVNVDACAEVIQKNTPPVTQRQRKINTFVFTIKIVEAEDLKACDINGASDPYVVLGDEYQKRLAKTRIIYANLNPRWDESVDITTQGPLNIIATIWDWDTLGDHDCVGRTSIKLDPSHFSDYLPREYWLDLDTQGRLLLRVSMEGERDDIQFYFGKAFRTLKRTERDMTRQITDKLSAYINHCLSRSTLRGLLNKGISMASVSSLFSRAQRAQPPPQGPTQADIANALRPLFQYFDDNFAIMKQTLTDAAMVMVMTRLWKEVLITVEGLLVPPLSDKPSQQRQLNQQELDIVFKWLELLFAFFNAVDEETGESDGVPTDVLKSPKYHEIQSLNFFYFDPTDNLIRTSERMASATATRQQQQRNRLSAPGALQSQGAGGAPSFGGAVGLMGVPSTRRSKSIMLSRNLGTIKRAKEEKRKEAQADPSDDMILRILRMRPEAASYLRDRSRQKERLAAAAAAELIVRQSLAGGGGRMTANLPRR